MTKLGNLRILFAFLFLGTGRIAVATELKGVVLENDVGGSPVEGVSVDSPGANHRETHSDGQFVLNFAALHSGDTVNLVISKAGFVVVNTVQLEQVLPSNPDTKILVILICRPSAREEMARRFYRLNSVGEIEANFQRRQKEIPSTDRAQLDRLIQERNQAEARAAELAEKLAKAIPGQTSTSDNQTMRLFLDGRIEEALKVQKASSIAIGLGRERGRLAPPEVSLLWQLVSADESVRFSTLRNMLSQSSLTADFNRRPGPILQAAVGISPLRQRVIDELLLPNLDDSRPLPERLALMHLGARLQVEDPRFGSFAMRVVKQELSESKDKEELFDVAISVCDLAPQLSSDEAADAFSAYLPASPIEADANANVYFDALHALAQHFDDKQIMRARQQIISALGIPNRKWNSRPLVDLALGMPSPLDDAQSGLFFNELANQWNADEDTASSLLEVVRHSPLTVRQENLQRLVKLADTGRYDRSWILLTPAIRVISSECAGQSGVDTPDILFLALKRAKYPVQVTFAASGLRACVNTLAPDRAQVLANQIADFIIGEYKRAGDPVTYNDFKGGFDTPNPVYMLPVWLDAVAALGHTLDTQRAKSLLAKAKGVDIDSDELKQVTPPLVAAISLMEPTLAHQIVAEMLNSHRLLSGTTSEQSWLSTLGDLAQAVSLQVTRSDWNQFADVGQIIIEQIVGDAIKYANSPVGHDEASLGAIRIVPHFTSADGLKLRDRLFQKLLKSDPAYYDTKTLVQIAAALEDKFTEDQVSALSRAWNFRNFNEKWRFELLGSLPGKVPIDIGLKWLDIFFGDCVESSDTYFNALFFASQLLPPRVSAKEARQFLLSAMTNEAQQARYEANMRERFAYIPESLRYVGSLPVDTDVLLAHAISATDERVPGQDAAIVVHRLMQRWLTPDLHYERRSFNHLTEAINAIIVATASDERVPLVEELLSNLPHATDPGLQLYVAQAMRKAVEGAQERTGPALFDLLVAASANEGDPVVQFALLQGIAAIPGQISIADMAEFLKSPFCSGNMRTAAFTLIARRANLGVSPRLPDITRWLEEQGIDTRRPPKNLDNFQYDGAAQ